MLFLCELDIMRNELFPLALFLANLAWASQQSQVGIGNIFMP